MYKDFKEMPVWQKAMEIAEEISWIIHESRWL